MPSQLGKMKPVSRSSLRISKTPETLEDNSIAEYSRCLTPRQERDQINKELGFSTGPRWKKVAKKPFKTIGRFVKRYVEGKKNPGTLILVRCGESDFSTNFTFTGMLEICFRCSYNILMVGSSYGIPSSSIQNAQDGQIQV